MRSSALGEIDHIAIVVANMNATIRFYQRCFGFAVERRFGNRELGVKAVVLKCGGSRIELFAYSNTKPQFAKRRRLVHGARVPKEYFEPGIRHIAFRTRGFAGAVAGLKKKGLHPIVQPKTGYSGDSITFFHDPNGIMLEVVSPLGRRKPVARRKPPARRKPQARRTK